MRFAHVARGQAPGLHDKLGFASRPSGTEENYKIYTESFVDRDHLARIQREAKQIVQTAFDAAGA